MGNIFGYLRKNLVLSVGYKALSTITQIFVLPFAARELGVTEFAQYVFFVALLNWAVVLNFGVSSTVIKRLAEEKRQDVVAVFFLFLLRLLSILTFIVGVLVTVLGIEVSAPLVFVGLSIWLSTLMLPIEGKLNYKRLVHEITIANLFASIASITLVGLLAALNQLANSQILLFSMFTPLLLSKLFFIVREVDLRSLVSSTSKQKIDLNYSQILKYFTVDQANTLVMHLFPVLLYKHLASDSDVVKHSFFMTMLGVTLLVQSNLLNPMRGIMASSVEGASSQIVGLRTKFEVLTALQAAFFLSLGFIYGEQLVLIWLDGVIAYTQLELRWVFCYCAVFLFETFYINYFAFTKYLDIAFRIVLLKLLVMVIGTLFFIGINFSSLVSFYTVVLSLTVVVFICYRIKYD
jgi:O-antigen/teichoic acid export membrane protein